MQRLQLTTWHLQAVCDMCHQNLPWHMLPVHHPAFQSNIAPQDAERRQAEARAKQQKRQRHLDAAQQEAQERRQLLEDQKLLKLAGRLAHYYCHVQAVGLHHPLECLLAAQLVMLRLCCQLGTQQCEQAKRVSSSHFFYIIQAVYRSITLQKLHT